MSITARLPKLYSPVRIKFSSLRAHLGPNMGVMPDCDEQVVRTVVRVRTPGGWKWQIKDILSKIDWDYTIEQDQEILDNHLETLEYELVD